MTKIVGLIFIFYCITAAFGAAIDESGVTELKFVDQPPPGLEKIKPNETEHNKNEEHMMQQPMMEPNATAHQKSEEHKMEPNMTAPSNMEPPKMEANMMEPKTAALTMEPNATAHKKSEENKMEPNMMAPPSMMDHSKMEPSKMEPSMMAPPSMESPKIEHLPMMEQEVMSDFSNQISIRFSEKHVCGGVLISPEIAITSAQCAYYILEVKKHDNIFDQMSIKVDGSVRPYSISRVSWFKGFVYNESATYADTHDIGVIRLQTMVKDIPNLHFPELPKERMSFPLNTTLHLNLFPTYSFGSKREVMSKRMLANSTIISYDKCDKNYNEKGSNYKPTYICVRPKSKFNRGYQGDTGSPVFWNNMLVGIVSRVARKDGKVEYYTNVSEFLDYINDEINFDVDPEFTDDFNISFNTSWAKTLVEETGGPYDILHDVPNSNVFALF